MEKLIGKFGWTSSEFREFFKGKAVLVTGHTGFKGAWLSIWLNDMGARVVGYALDPPYKNSLFEITNLKDRIVDVRGDLRNFEKLESVFKEYKPDIVLHLAAQAIVRLAYDFPRETFETNVLGTINVMECLRKYKTKSAVLITSDKCYKNIEQEKGYVETDIFSDKDPYSCSKGCIEIVAQCYRNSFGLKVATPRAGNVIGGGDWAADRLVPDIFRALKKQEKIIIRNPTSTRPWLLVLEPLSGYLLLAKKQYEGDNLSEGWNFGPKRASIVPVKQIVEMIINNFGSGKLEVQGDESGKHEAGLLSLDSTKAKQRLEWQPKLNIQETISYVTEWYKDYENKDPHQLCIEQIKRYEEKND